MNGITHKQAINLINRRLDGLLNESQLLILEQHLRSCDSCRNYATEMALLPARLQNKFRLRWDGKPGPSQKVVEEVMTKARNIPMTNRISSGIKVFTGAAALVLMAVLVNFVISGLRNTSVSGTEPALNNDVTPAASVDTVNRLLAFASDQNGNFDIYTMRADGSELTNITNNPAYDGNPFWSPDGKRIASTSDRDGSLQIYLMNADGSNVTQLPIGEGNSNFDVNGPSPWSPDGRQIAFSASTNGEFDLWLVNEDGTGLLYIDRHLVHEVTSPQAFEGLRMAGRTVRRPDATIAVADHNVPTTDRSKGIDNEESRIQVETLAENCRAFGVPYFDMTDVRQGIVHIIGPEQGMTLPGTTWPSRTTGLSLIAWTPMIATSG